ncbi:hypothetical protein MA9V1_047 [Chryseobacterium phage MA9V-1]|nr:hypothetical protein MA9V1_047 [Chryseobacterium phage MA9V-1]
MSKGLFDNSYNSTELTKININPYEVFAIKDDELHHVRLEAQAFMHERKYDEYIFIKYTHKKQLNALAANRIFEEVSKEFVKTLSLIEVFAVITNYFEINEKEYYAQLSPKFQEDLKNALIETTTFKRREMFCTKADGDYYMPEL